MVGVMSEFEWCTRSRIGVGSELGRSVKCVKCENMSVSWGRGCTNLSTPVPKKREEGPGHQATRRLGKIWIDLTGPTAVMSRHGHNLIMNILDDYMSYLWSIMLANKAEAFD